MAVYRSAQGRMIDMSALAARHEKTRAVGNMKVNARGDTIDAQGKIVKPVTEKVTDQYSKTVGNRGSHVVRQPAKPQKKQEPEYKPKIELTEFERQFEEEDISEQELKILKEKEKK